jgi:hypothetical protein
MFDSPVAILLTLVRFAMLGTCLFALVDAAQRPTAAFVLNNKLTKPLWCGILAAGCLLSWFGGLFLGPFALVAGIVYLVDVKPAVSGSGSSW